MACDAPPAPLRAPLHALHNTQYPANALVHRPMLLEYIASEQIKVWHACLSG